MDKKGTEVTEDGPFPGNTHFSYDNPALELDSGIPSSNSSSNDQEEETPDMNDRNDSKDLPNTCNGVYPKSQLNSNITMYKESNSYSLQKCKNSKGFCDKLFHFMLMKNYPQPDSQSISEQIRYAFLLPPHGIVGNIFTWVLFILTFWGALIAITGQTALPGGNLFALLVLIILAEGGGKLTNRLRLPPLLGMIIVGVLLRSVPGLNLIGNSIDNKWSATIRKMALVVILTRAGLGLDPKALRELSFAVIRLGIIPNLVEMAVVAVVSHFLLHFPWLWSFMLGFIFSGVSPSVVVPCMLNLSDRRLGVEKGIPTLIIAGLSIDNALSISGFGVFLGIIFSSGSIVWQAFKGPVEVLVGISYGIVMGMICWHIPNKFEKGFAKFRFFFLLTVGLISVFGSQRLNFGGAGAMGCLTTAFVAGIGWRNQGWPDNKHPVKKNFNFLWYFFQPLLFGLIGTEIQIDALNGSTVLRGAITLLIGLVFRFIACFTIVQGSTLNLKEKFFTAISWIPKATIQAAFGSTALDFARSINKDPTTETPEIVLGRQVLTLAVLAIVIAAPIGAVAIMLSAPRLLKHTPLEEQHTTDDLEAN